MAREVSMVMRGRHGCVLAICLLAGCRSGPTESQESLSRALSASTSTLTFAVPPSADSGGCVLIANGSATLDDRSVVSNPICNVGNGGTTIGADARAADILTRAALVTRDRAAVSGRVDTTVAIQKAPTSTIVGPINTHASFDPVAVETRTIVFPAAADLDITLEPDQVATRDPGRYRNLTIKSRARLNLRTGTYFFETLGVIEPQAVISLDERSGPVVVYVKQPFVFRGSIVSNIGQPDWLIGVTGTGAISIEAPFQGTIVAPNCAIVVGTVGTTHSGAFVGKDIELQPGVRILFRPSSQLRPQRPTCPLRDDFPGTVLAPFWTSYDAGSPAGSTAVNGTLRLTGGGPGLTGTKDGMNFLHQAASGDIDVAVKVNSVASTSGFAGLLIRSDLSTSSAFVAVGISGAGATSLRKRTAGGQTATSQQAASVSPAFPVWLRLSKEGQAVTAYRSSDGFTWQSVGSSTVAFPGGYQIGLVSSGSTSAASLAVFQSFAVPFAGDCGKCLAGGSP